MAFYVSEPGTEGREAAVYGTAIFGPIGVGLLIGGVAELYRRIRLTIRDDTVLYERRALFKPLSFSEPLGNYACVLPSSALSGSQHQAMRMAFYARLVHRTDDSRNTVLLIRVLDELGVHTDWGGERKPYEDFARSVNLPLATEAADGSITIRYPDELDMTIEEFNRATGIAPVEPGPPRDFPTQRYRVSTQEDGFSAVRGYPVYWIPFAGFVAAAIISGMLMVNDADLLGLPLVFTFFSLFMGTFALTKAKLELRDKTVIATYTAAGIRLVKQSIPLSEIEELVVASDPRYRKSVLRIASDRTTISWGAGDSDEELAWFKDALARHS